MSTKLKNTLIILAIAIFVSAIGIVYVFIVQRGKISDREKKIKEMTVFQLDTEVLQEQLITLKKKAAQLDSILANRKYILAADVTQSKFFDFITKISYSLSSYTTINMEYVDIRTIKNYFEYGYNLNGVAEYNDFNKLLYAIEESKAIKKVSNIELTNNVKLDDDQTAHYLVNFKMRVGVLFTNDDKIAAKDYQENRLVPNPVYDAFFPLIRSEIPPNRDKLLDVQSARLLALIPDGAFLSDVKGTTYLLWEGDKVYLGYITKIDYEKNQVQFILNKGGIVEKVVLNLEKEIKPEQIK